MGKFKKGIIELHEQFIDLNLSQPIDSENIPNNTNHQNNDANPTGVHEEFQRHRNYLERTVQGLQKKLIKDSAGFKKDSTRIMQENVALIKEINELRKEISIAQKMKYQQNKSSHPTIKSLKKEIKENQNEIEELIHLKQQLEAIENRR